MKPSQIAVLLSLSVAACTGCATKNYVRGQVTPLIEKVNELDSQTAQSSQEIKDVDSRSTDQIQATNASAEQTTQKALAAEQEADKAQQSANDASSRAKSLSDEVANIDNYKVIDQTSVEFPLNDDRLTTEATEQLDTIGTHLPKARDYVIDVEGGTDSSGDPNHNYSLSDRRAEAVMNYLVTKHGVPFFRIHTVGLGADRPVASDRTTSGRAQNRRASVQILSNAFAPESAKNAVSNNQ